MTLPTLATHRRAIALIVVTDARVPARRGHCRRHVVIGSLRATRYLGSIRTSRRIDRSSASQRRRPGKGYWLAAADGGVFTFGDAHVPRLDRRTHAQPHRSSASPRHRRATATGSSHRDGGVFTFGDATFHGSTGGRTAHRTHRRHRRAPRRATATGSSRPTVASSPSATPRSTAPPSGHTLAAPIVGIAATPIGPRLLARGVRRRRLHLRRRARSTGRSPRRPRPPRSSASPRPVRGTGYWLVAADGSTVRVRSRAHVPTAVPGGGGSTVGTRSPPSRSVHASPRRRTGRLLGRAVRDAAPSASRADTGSPYRPTPPAKVTPRLRP